MNGKRTGLSIQHRRRGEIKSDGAIRCDYSRSNWMIDSGESEGPSGRGRCISHKSSAGTLSRAGLASTPSENKNTTMLLWPYSVLRM